MIENYYALLDIPETADPAAIDTAIQARYRRENPRVNSPKREIRQEAERVIELLDAAGVVLLDPAQRAAYDAKLAEQAAQPSEESSPERPTTAPNADADVTEGRARLDSDDLDGAMRLAMQATSKDGGNAEAWALLGEVKRRSGSLDQALYEYNRAVSLMPSEPRFHHGVGSVYEDAKDLESAEEAYGRAMELGPEQPLYKLSMASVFRQQGRIDEAIDLLEPYVDDESVNPLIIKGFVRAQAQKLKEVVVRDTDTNAFVETIPRMWSKKSEIDAARTIIVRLKELAGDDRGLLSSIFSIQESLDEAERYQPYRRFWKVGVLASLLWGALGYYVAGEVAAVALAIVIFALYWWASRAPGYYIWRRHMNGVLPHKELTNWEFLGGLFFQPLDALWRLYRNYVLAPRA